MADIIDFPELTEHVVRRMVNNMEAEGFATTTATTNHPEPFTMRKLMECRFMVEGFAIKEKTLLSDKCIEFETKDPAIIVWYDLDTQKIYKLDTKKILDDMMDFNLEYKPTNR